MLQWLWLAPCGARPVASGFSCGFWGDVADGWGLTAASASVQRPRALPPLLGGKGWSSKCSDDDNHDGNEDSGWCSGCGGGSSSAGSFGLGDQQRQVQWLFLAGGRVRA